MSAPRIKVEYVWDDDAYTDVIPEWRCLACTHGLHDYPAGTWGVASTLSDAADAGRAHLARFHTAQMPAGTRWDSHGTHSAECGCGSGKSPAGVENGAYNAAQAIDRTFNESRADV